LKKDTLCAIASLCRIVTPRKNTYTKRIDAVNEGFQVQLGKRIVKEKKMVIIKED